MIMPQPMQEGYFLVLRTLNVRDRIQQWGYRRKMFA
jgi:hypothetical protein